MSNEQTKKPWQSGGIVTGALMLVFGLLQISGYTVEAELESLVLDPETISKITTAETIKGVVNVILGIAVAYFRLRAKKAIEGGIEGVKDAVTKPVRWVTGLFQRKQKE